MFVHIVGLCVLAGIFVIGTARPINLGVLALIATFAVGGLVVGESVDEMLAGFPADLFVLLVGVTYLFGVASANGTVEWVVEAAVRKVGDRRALVPWMIFAVAAVPTTVGALGPAGVALLAPMAIRIAARHGVDQRMAALMVIFGSAAGNFSPLNVLGVIVNGTAQRGGLDVDPIALFAVSAAFCVLVGIAVFVLYGGLGLLRAGGRVESTEPSGARPPADSPDASGGGVASVSSANGPGGRAGGAAVLEVDGEVDVRTATFGPVQAITSISVLVVAVAALAFGADVGVMALVAAGLLHLALPASSKGAEAKIAWGVVLLICGIITYVAALTRYGTVDLVAERVSGIGAPLVAALLICFVGAAVSAFASSTGILGALIPLAIPLLSQGEVSATGVIIALALCATLVDATPFSTVGALCVAASEEPDRPHMHRALLRFGLSMIVVAPVATWLVLVVPLSI